MAPSRISRQSRSSLKIRRSSSPILKFERHCSSQYSNMLPNEDPLFGVVALENDNPQNRRKLLNQNSWLSGVSMRQWVWYQLIFFLVIDGVSVLEELAEWVVRLSSYWLAIVPAALLKLDISPPSRSGLPASTLTGAIGGFFVPFVFSYLFCMPFGPLGSLPYVPRIWDVTTDRFNEFFSVSQVAISDVENESVTSIRFLCTFAFGTTLYLLVWLEAVDYNWQNGVLFRLESSFLQLPPGRVFGFDFLCTILGLISSFFLYISLISSTDPFMPSRPLYFHNESKRQPCQ